MHAPKTDAAPAPARQSFAAMRHPGFRALFVTSTVAMMADNIEHVISYWVVFQKFESQALLGFAVVSHWLPFLMFSVAAGALADRFDPRRIVQCGMALFIIASLGWGYFFITGTLQMWHAMVLLVLHGCAGVLWSAPGQVLLYDIVGPADLPSAVRLNATSRYLGVLAGHAALLSELGDGELSITLGARTDRFTISGGYVEIRDNHVRVLADRAE